MEKIIQIVTVLFILSMIFERINEFLKKYLSCKKVVGVGWYIVGDTTTKFPAGSKEEKRREYRILKMNLFIGFLTSFLAHASFFDLLRNIDNPGKVIGWPDLSIVISGNINFGTPFQFVIGCLFTGAFISMGSKFWHDLLDLLLYTKNLKEKLSQAETYKFDKLEDLDQWLNVTQSDVVKKVFDENKEVLKNLKNVISVAIENDAQNNRFIKVVISDQDTHLIPKSLPYQLSNGITVPVNIKIVTSSPIMTQVKPLDDITNEKRANSYGSFGCMVCFKNDRNQNPMLLSCYHVLKSSRHDFDSFSVIGEEQIISPHNTNSFIGRLRFGVRSNEIDAAIMDVIDGTLINNLLPSGASISGYRELKYEEQFNNIAVMVYGANAKNGGGTKGFIRSMFNYATINYSINGQTVPWDLYNLIAISDAGGNAITLPGDSGAAVLDVNNKIVGMVVGGSNQFTYAIPIITILNYLNLKVL